MNGETPAPMLVGIMKKMQAELIPRLMIDASLADLSNVAMRKTSEHDAYDIDLWANRMFISTLRDQGFTGAIFTEESGWLDSGDQADGVVICDPYDNTSLTFRGFRESSVVATLGSSATAFQASVIADLQQYRILYCTDSTDSELLTKDGTGIWTSRPCRTSDVRDIGKAHVAVSLMKRKRRVPKNPDINLFNNVGTLHAVDGAMMIARVALGEIDAYVDAYIGQPAYELPAIELVRRAGGVVTDDAGTDLTFVRIVDVIRTDPDARIKIIAAANHDLHEQIMACRSSV